MKFLEIPGLEQAVSELNSLENTESTLIGTAEIFSLKLAGDDKQLYHELNRNYENFALSPTNLSISPFGPLTDKTSRKILIYFVTTLNHVYSGHDFSEVRGNDFSKEPSFGVAFNHINSTIQTSFPEFFTTGLKKTMWDLIQSHIAFEECQIYRFSPQSDLDPLANALWSLHYFFFNKNLKRVLYFSCAAKLKSADYDVDDIDDYDDCQYFDMEL